MKFLGGVACFLTATRCWTVNIQDSALDLPAWFWVIAGIGWALTGFSLICGRPA